MIEPVGLNDIFLSDDNRAVVYFPVLSVDEVNKVCFSIDSSFCRILM